MAKSNNKNSSHHVEKKVQTAYSLQKAQERLKKTRTLTTKKMAAKSV